MKKKISIHQLLPAILIIISLAGYFYLGWYSYKVTHRNFVYEKTSSYDSSKTKDYNARDNVKDDPGIIYRKNLAELYGTEPVVVIKNGANK